MPGWQFLDDVRYLLGKTLTNMFWGRNVEGKVLAKPDILGFLFPFCCDGFYLSAPSTGQFVPESLQLQTLI